MNKLKELWQYPVFRWCVYFTPPFIFWFLTGLGLFGWYSRSYWFGRAEISTTLIMVVWVLILTVPAVWVWRKPLFSWLNKIAEEDSIALMAPANSDPIEKKPSEVVKDKFLNKSSNNQGESKVDEDCSNKQEKKPSWIESQFSSPLFFLLAFGGCIPLLNLIIIIMCIIAMTRTKEQKIKNRAGGVLVTIIVLWVLVIVNSQYKDLIYAVR